jgi:hypothetical protein
MDSVLDVKTKAHILENLGRTCANENRDSFAKFKNNPEGFLENN